MLNLLHSWGYIPAGLHHWADTDTEANYQSLLAKHGPEWAWADSTVEYWRNSQGFRCPEFDTIDWANSTLMLGCSFVFGTGLDEPDTLPSCLGAVNLGHYGASVMHIWANTQRMVTAGIKPKRVIYVWPSTIRSTQFTGGDTVANGGPWNLADNALFKAWAFDSTHNINYAQAAVESSRLMWSCPVYNYTWCPDLARATGARLLPSRGYPFLALEDQARDGAHPGPDVVDEWARLIARDLD